MTRGVSSSHELSSFTEYSTRDSWNINGDTKAAPFDLQLFILDASAIRAYRQALTRQENKLKEECIMHIQTIPNRAVVRAVLFSFVLITTPPLARPAENQLFNAAKTGSLDKVTALIGRGVNINYKGNHGLTALIYPALFGQEQVCQLLLSQGANVERRKHNV